MTAGGAPLLIALPDGLNVSGVASWAVRLANGLAERGRGIALVLHPEPPGQSRLEFRLDPRVRVSRPPGLPRFGEGCDLTRVIAAYRDAVRALACDFGGPVVISPNLHGDCYGAAAALTLADPELVRLVGWQHSDNEYDARVLSHYQPALAAAVAVSDRIERTLRGTGFQPVSPSSSLCPHVARASSPCLLHSTPPSLFANIPYGVETDLTRPASPPNPRASARLIYLGRLEHRQKRVLSLVRLSRELSVRGLAHTLTVAGDGPAAKDFAAAAREIPEIRIIGAVTPARARELLHAHDLFVLPSRFEGLSVAMLEAMAAGCVPVVARTESGALQAIERGYNGEIADAAPEADEEETGVAMADAVARALKRGIPALSAAAMQTARERFSLSLHVDRVEAVLDEAAASPARAWPATRPCAFTCGAGVPPAASGSVPPDGPERMRAALAKLADRAVVVHGTGEHTRQLGAIFGHSSARIVAFTDDDRAVHGGTIWNWPIVPPEAAAQSGATDVLISSWMHERAIWDRRSLYERQGLRVVRVYA